MKKFVEFVESDFKPLTSFKLKDELNPDVWDGNKIDDDIRTDLLRIADDYIEFCQLQESEIVDVLLVGSLCFYNWSSYSDFDLHILVDFKKIDDNVELVKKYLDNCKRLWSLEHDILISGYEVELYCQDINELNASSGVFSLTNNEWVKIPKKEDFTPDTELIKSKATTIMNKIDDVEKDFNDGVDYDTIKEKLHKVWTKIKEGRKAGLEDNGEFSIENLVFKLLRRNGYSKKIFDIRRKAYDKQFK